MIYELFRDNDGTLSFLRAAPGNEAELKRLRQFATKVWEYDAKSHFEAMRAYHEFQGWDEWIPEPDWDDIVFDE